MNRMNKTTIRYVTCCLYVCEDGGADSQLQPLIDLITSPLKAITEQQQAHARQIEEQKQTLTKIFTQQVETLKVEVAAMI